jgi:hypothetical protein
MYDNRLVEIFQCLRERKDRIQVISLRWRGREGEEVSGQSDFIIALPDQAYVDLKLTRRELLEECQKRSLGDPSGIFDD